MDDEFADDFPGYKSPKLQAVIQATKDHLTNHPETGAVLFCEYNGGIEAMKSSLIEEGYRPEDIGVYTGKVSSQRKRRDLQNDLNSGKIKILLGNTAALETGANLQKRANFVAHLNTPWAPDRLVQSTGRVHRQGQERKVTVFRPTGSEVEELIERVVSRKLLQSSQATGVTMAADSHVAVSMRRKGREKLDSSTIAKLLGIDPSLLSQKGDEAEREAAEIKEMKKRKK
ncbi:MAG: helicase-related protein [Thermoleophilia bacterium]